MNATTTFAHFHRTVQQEYAAGQYTDALTRLKMINRFQWLNKIDSFEIIEAMWQDDAYTAEEIIEEWLVASLVSSY